MDSSIKLGHKLIDNYSAPYLIAEIGVNHEGSIDIAKKLIDLAKEGGADAAKFQTYKAGKLASRFSPSYWDLNKEQTKSQFELFSKYDSFGIKDYEILYEHCLKNEIDFLSTGFDKDSIDFLDPMMDFYKISSSDITNLPLLRHIASKNKNVVLSTGASTLDEIYFAIKVINEINTVDIALLHCILNYPTPNHDANLNMISEMRNRFKGHIIGYSDHTLPDKEMKVLSFAYLLGARIIEKHFTHDKQLPGNDHYHAMDVNDLKVFKERLRETSLILGDSRTKRPIISEDISRKNARRSLVLNKNLKKGSKIKYTDLDCKRPGHGISPVEIEKVIGLEIKNDLNEDQILDWEFLS